MKVNETTSVGEGATLDEQLVGVKIIAEGDGFL